MSQTTLTKTLVAELFGVSRSAVTQSTRGKTLEQDIKVRIAKYVMPKKADELLKSGELLDIIKVKASRLLKKAELQFQKREVNKNVKGRPSDNISLSVLEELIEQVVFMFQDSLTESAVTVKKYSLSAMKFIYMCCQIVHKRWKCLYANSHDSVVIDESNVNTTNVSSTNEVSAVAEVAHVRERSQRTSHYWENWTTLQKINAIDEEFLRDMALKNYYDGENVEELLVWEAVLPKTYTVQ